MADNFSALNVGTDYYLILIW